MKRALAIPALAALSILAPKSALAKGTVINGMVTCTTSGVAYCVVMKGSTADMLPYVNYVETEPCGLTDGTPQSLVPFITFLPINSSQCAGSTPTATGTSTFTGTTFRGSTASATATATASGIGASPMGSPCSAPGKIEWNAADQKIEWCDGQFWHLPSGGGPTSSCSGVPAGKLDFFSGDIHYCDGSSWHRMQGTNAGNCTGVKPGTIQYDPAVKQVSYCDSTGHWRKMD